MSASRFTISERTAAVLGWPDVLTHLATFCHTDRGKEAALLLPFLDSAEQVEAELELLGEARALEERGDPLPFGSVWDLRLPLRRLEKEGVLEGPVLLQVGETLRAGARLKRFVQGHSATTPALARLAGGLHALDDISGPIGDSFDEHGVLADHASADLGRLRRKRSELHERLGRRMRNLMEEPTIAKFLQDRFYTQREERYVLPVRSDAGPAVEGIVHGSSASGATLFVEPQQVVGLNNELKVAEMEVLREEARILASLSALVREEWQAIWDNLELLQRFDLISARARLAIRLAAQRPRLASNGELQLLGMRHPLMLLAGMQVIANDLELPPRQTLIISGPNAGGKTVCLKTLGLCALMLRAGMQVPAGLDSVLPLYDGVLTEMGDDQSIERNLSTFTAHLRHLMDFLDEATPSTLVLLDEIAVGTDPEEGAALAQSLLEALAARGAQVVVTTHYERLKSLPIVDRRFENASVGFDMEQMAPTYRLHLALPGSSGALAVARRLGLAAPIADRAASLLSGGGQDLSRLLTELAGQRSRLSAQQEALARAEEEARRLVATHRRELEQLRQREQREQSEAFQRALDELKRARQDLERVRALLRRPPTKERLAQADRQISEAAARILPYEERKVAEGRTARSEELEPGTRVLVQRLGGAGVVIAPPERGKVAVRVGGIRTQVAIEDVLLPLAEGAAPAARGAAAPKGSPAPSPAQGRGAGPEGNLTPVRTSQNTVDLRGLRVDEALAEADRAIDSAFRAGETVLFAIHGHGTGALRAALREHLPEHELVDHIQPGAMGEGGEGVTVIWLR